MNWKFEGGGGKRVRECGRDREKNSMFSPLITCLIIRQCKSQSSVRFDGMERAYMFKSCLFFLGL